MDKQELHISGSGGGCACGFGCFSLILILMLASFLFGWLYERAATRDNTDVYENNKTINSNDTTAATGNN